VTFDPSAEEIAEIVMLAAGQVRRFGIAPKVALVSHSSFGNAQTATAVKMRDALMLVRQTDPELEVEGEMQADVALSEGIREELFPHSRLSDEANLLIMPTLDAANIAFTMIKALGGGISIGPLLLGAAAPAHIVTPAATVRGLVNAGAVAVVEAGETELSPEPVLVCPEV
jgi:malate dehydrogenase (oxaloacetate-decarboxylating)(NADP+)